MLDALLLTLPVEGAVMRPERRHGGMEGGAKGRMSGGEREVVQKPLVFSLDVSHLVPGEGVVLMPLACTGPATADGGAAGTENEQRPVHPPARAQHGWRQRGRLEENMGYGCQLLLLQYTPKFI